MTPEYPILYLARVVLETTTPLSIATGIREAAFDSLLVRDANGLPAIPGSSLAGVLRSLFLDVTNTQISNSVFGYAEGKEGWPSRVHVSWGAIHDAQDRPVEGLLLGEDEKRLKEDLLLHSVIGDSPITRDHIRIHHRGAGDSKGKYDRTALHSGHRFSFEISFWSKGDHCSSAANDADIWNTLLNLLHHPGFRLGGHTRRGLGAVKVVRAHHARFVLYETEDYSRYSALDSSPSATAGLSEYTFDDKQEDWVSCTLELHPEEGWRFGQGETPLTTGGKGDQEGKDADMLPVTEPRVFWDGGHGEIGPPRVFIPASGIKGPLAHRVAFHYDCLAGDWTSKERCDLDRSETDTPPHKAVAALFGHAKRKDSETPFTPDQPIDEVASNDKECGRAGWLYIDDVYLDRGLSTDRETHRQWHNGIDRFTGGVRQHVLYGEELIWQNSIHLTLRIDPAARDLDDDTKKALRLALKDLCEGHLAIGGGSGKGHGYCQGTAHWSDNGKWIGETR